MNEILDQEVGKNHGGMTRRAMLRATALVAIGGGVVLVGYRAFAGASQVAVNPVQTLTRSLTSTTNANAPSGAPIKVKVMYFQMQQMVSPGEEYYVLGTPARFGDLLSKAIGRHPSIAGMASKMMILVDGVTANAGTQLKDGQEIDFIAAYAGG